MSEQVDTRTFDKADEVRTFTNGRLEIIRIGDREVGRTVFEPGWRWSNDVKPIAQTDFCQVHHVGYMLQGTDGRPDGRRHRARADRRFGV